MTSRAVLASRRALSLAAIVTLLVGSAPAPSDAAIRCPSVTTAPDSHPLTSATMIFYGLRRDGTRVRASRFTAASLNELLVRVDWTEVASGQVQRIELTAPDGSIYQRKTATLEKARPRQTAPVRVDTQVPVAGTWIMQHAMYGKWCARVYLDREPDPVVQRPFYLTGP